MSEWYTLTKNNNNIDISCSRNTSSTPRAVVAMIRGQKSYRPLVINQLGVTTHEDSSGGSMIVDWDTNAITLEVPYVTALSAHEYNNSTNYSIGVFTDSGLSPWTSPNVMRLELYNSVERIGYKSGAYTSVPRYVNNYTDNYDFYLIYWCRSYEMQNNVMVSKNVSVLLNESAGYYNNNRFYSGTLPDNIHTATELVGVYSYQELLTRLDNNANLATLKTNIDSADTTSYQTTYDYKCVVVKVHPVNRCQLVGNPNQYITNVMIQQEGGWVFDTSIVFPWMADGIVFNGTNWVSDGPDGHGNESSLINTGTSGILGSRWGGSASCTRTISDSSGNTSYAPTVTFSASGPIANNNNYTGYYDSNTNAISLIWGEVGQSQQQSTITVTLSYTNVLRADGTYIDAVDNVSLYIDNGTY